MLTYHWPKHLAKSNISGAEKHILSVVGATASHMTKKVDTGRCVDLGIKIQYAAARLGITTVAAFSEMSET